MKLGKRLKEWTKGETTHFLIFAVSMAIILGMYIFFSGKIEKEFIVVPDDFSYMFEIESIEEQGKKLILKGWNFKLNQDSKEHEYDIILYDAKKDKGYYADIQYSVREDVNNYFLCDFDYRYSGFIAVFSVRELEWGENYEILIRPRGEGREAYATRMYLCENQVLRKEVGEFSALEVKDTDLEEVVESGSLRGYWPNEGMYVYQYLGKLYYIFTEEPQTGYAELFVPLFIYTTQNGRLPEEDQISGFDNLSFYFRTNELMTNSGYRVAVRDLPTEYAVTYFETGEYIIGTGWKWREKGRVALISN